ncbi:MAG: serine hydrolase [Cyclobacteriaceae bacterium]
MKRISLLLLFCVLSINFVYAQSKALTKQLKEFDAYVDNARKQWDAVGMAIAVVKDNEVIFKKAYGVKELNTNNAVDNNTLFACASTTKLMTATSMGILVDEGKVNWNDPVIKYLPEFQLYDPYVTREMRVKDLFLHNSGVGNTDFLWAFMDIPSEEVLERMRLITPSYSFRSSFIYQNIFYLAAGQLIEKVSGKPWEVFVKERIFNPLGMNNTYPTLEAAPDTNRTKPHMKMEGKNIVIEDMSADAIGPAGSVWSSIDDMSKWTKSMLDSSKYAGGRLVQAKTWEEITKVHTLVPSNEFYPTAQLTKPNFTTYGLGWFQHDYKGKKVNFHTGSLPGSIAIHGQIPEEKIAVYVFGNTDHVEVRHALMYKAFDLFALGGATDWSSDFLKLYTELNLAGEAAQKAQEKKRVANTKPSLPLSAYTGSYQDELLGEVLVAAAGDKLTVNINNMHKATLSHWNFDTFKGPMDKKWNGDLTALFHLNSAGEVSTLDLAGFTLQKVK